MLEGIGVYLINYYLGEFLEDINNDQLSVQFLSGEVVLENVPLRRGAMQRFGLPINVQEGNVAKIKIIRPSYQRFFYDPFIIEISGLNVVLGPNIPRTDVDGNYDDEEEDIKLRRIDSLVKRWQAVGQQQGLWASYSSSIISEIVQNIQIQVSDVNISYCDEEILQSRSIGFHATEISVKNVTNDATKSIKEMDLIDLSVYWNYGSANEYLMHPVNSNIEIHKDKNPNPLTGGDPRFKVNLNIGDVIFQLSDKQHHIIYSIVEKLDWFYKRQRFKKGRPQRQISEVLDSTSPKGDKQKCIRKWWQWVINHHYLPIERYHKRNTSSYLSQRCKDITKYSNIIRALLKKEILDEEQKAAKIRIENEWEYEECKLVIYATIDSEFKPVKDGSNLREGWGSWMMRGAGLFRPRTSSYDQQNARPSTGENSIEPLSDEIVNNQVPNLTLKTSLTNHQKFLPDFSITNDTFLTRDELFANFIFNLASGTVHLKVESPDHGSATRVLYGSDVDGLSHARCLTRIQFKGLNSLISCKFRSETLVYILQLEEFTVYDDYTQDTIYPKLVYTVPTKSNMRLNIKETSTNVLYFSFERIGLYQRIYCETAPLTIIHNAELLKSGVGFFQKKSENAIDSLEYWRQRERYRGVKLGAKKNIRDAWENLTGKVTTVGIKYHVTLDLAAPKIILPQNVTNENSPQILIDFGRLKFSNVEDDDIEEIERFFTPEITPPNERADGVDSQSNFNPEELQERLLVSKLYHKYSIQLCDLQILVGKQNDAWRAASSAGKSSLHVIERFNVSLGLERRAFDVVEDIRYPMAMLSGTLPSLTLHLNETKCATLFACLDQLSAKKEPELNILKKAKNNDVDLDEIQTAAHSTNVSKLIVMIFQIDRVTCGLASEMYNDQTIAALEITHVKTELKLSSGQHNCKLSIASLVLADCYQQLGPDFEFILASNRNMSIDIPSGTIIDSGATSPTYEDQLADYKVPSSPNFVSKLTENLLGLLSPSDTDSEMHSNWSEPKDELAVVEWSHWEHPEDSDIGDDFHVKFSSLDIVATPPSLAVLLRLLHRLQPIKERSDNHMTESSEGAREQDPRIIVCELEVSTVNLMIASVEHGLGKKVASAGIENFKSTTIVQNFGDVTIDGKIGAIHGLDLSLSNEVIITSRSQSNRIFSLGCSSSPDSDFLMLFSKIEPGKDAFNFEFKRNQEQNCRQNLSLNVDTASLCYLHSPKCLVSLLSCVEQFKAEFANRLTVEAQMMYQEVMSGLYQRVADFATGPTSLLDFSMALNFKSPYIALPKQPGSSEILFGQLGRISIQNDGLENFNIVLENAAVNSMVKHGIERMEDRGQILANTDLMVNLCTSNRKIQVGIDFSSEPIVTITKEAYEQILKSIDNIALPKEDEEIDDEDKTALQSDSDFTPIEAILHIHGLTIDMRDETNIPTVKFVFYDFKCNWQKTIPTVFDCDLVLGAIEAIDSLETPETHMLRSRKNRRSMRRSNSWPKINLTRSWMRDKRLCALKPDSAMKKKAAGPSMPTKLHGNIFSKEFGVVEESVVRISIKQQNPKDRCANRQIKINFSELEAGINLQTWVMLLDFLTPSSAPLARSSSMESSKSDGLTHQARTYRRQVMENLGTPVNIQIEFNVDRFSILFNKPEYQFAKASIQGLEMRLMLLEKTHRYSGSLASLTFYDLSPVGYKYRQRFVTMDKQVLNFELFRYTKPDIKCERDWDIRFKLRMCQIRYIHTHRFQSELIAYFLHFHQLLELVNHYRAALVGEEVTELGRGSRVKLDITATNPTLLLPESSHSDKIIIADLGHLTVANSFIRNGELGTLNHEVYEESKEYPTYKSLLDCITVQLRDMDIWTATRKEFKPNNSNTSDLSFDIVYNGFLVARDPKSLLTKRVVLSLSIERNLEQNKDRSVPDMSIVGTLTTAHFILNQSQFWIVRGFLDHNLGEMQPMYSRPAAPLGATPNDETVISGNVFTNMLFELGLKNVTVELGYSDEEKLVKMEFVESKLRFEAFSNNHKHTSLVCQSYNACDCRNNVSMDPSFRTVIKAVKGVDEDPDKVQVELFFKATPTGASFKVVMEKSRIIVLPDWMKTTLSFLLDHPDPTYNDKIRQKVLDIMLAANQEPHNQGGEDAQIEIGKRLPLDITSNVHGTEFVIINDLSAPSSHAIILRSTAVVQKNDFSTILSLQSLEVFSCEISNIEETSLSILDPTSLQLDVFQKEDEPIKLDLFLNQIRMRLSYNDYLLLHSIGENLKGSMNNMNQAAEPHVDLLYNYDKLKYESLVPKVAPDTRPNSQGSDSKRRTLFWRAYPLSTISQEDIIPQLPKLVELPPSLMTLSAERMSLTLIDDSGERDIPLIEVEAKELTAEATETSTSMNCTFVCCLFNQNLSLWEPFIEPFQIVCKGSRANIGYSINLVSKNRLNMNMTQNLLHLQKDLFSRITKLFVEPTSYNFDIIRKKFRPYTLQNRTGMPVAFSTSGTQGTWHSLEVGQDADFNFSRQHEKIRNYQQKMHRLWLKIEAWLPIEPVTVNKVGTFFRHGIHPHKPPIRIVVEVKLTSSARKLVTLRSAFQIISKINIPIKIYAHRESIDQDDGTPIDANVIGTIEPHGSLFVSLNDVNSSLRIKPVSKMHRFSENFIRWFDSGVNRNKSLYLNCLSNVNTDRSWNFFCRIEKLPFPFGPELSSEIDELHRRAKTTNKITSRLESNCDAQSEPSKDILLPGHNFYIYPGTVIKNLLPVELGFLLSGFSGTVSPHESQELYFAPEDMKLKIMLENFEPSKELILPRDRDVLTEARILDHKKRMLLLNIRVSVQPHICILVSARYWLVNHTSLPMIFRQKDVSAAAGQFDEHEAARCRTPLLFSYSDTDAPPYCQVRLGQQLHLERNPMWCNEFSLDDECYRELQAGSYLYYIGISVRNGSGDYHDTRIVTFSPRFILQNSTPFNLKFSQQHLVFGLWERDPANFVAAPSGSSCNFHWTDSSKPFLLCARASEPISSRWSGGFLINQVNTSYLNLRVGSTDLVFLEVEVIYHSAMFFVQIRDLNGIPPLIRVDNLSAVPVTVLQDGCRDASVRCEIPSESSLPYVFDEPALAEVLICQGEVRNSKPVCVALTDLESTATLHYENLLYLVSRELVLDVDGSKKIFVTKKDTSRRSQLWRIDSRGTMVNAYHSNYVLDPTTLQLTVYGKRSKIHTWHFKQNILCFGTKELYLNNLERLCFLGDTDEVHINAQGMTPFCRERMLKGSGQLELRVVRDGPRRVLQILDVVQSRAGTSVDSGCIFVESADRRHFLASTNPREFSTHFLLNIDMPAGIGISGIASVTAHGLEELFYLHATGFNLEYEIRRNTEKAHSLRKRGIKYNHFIEALSKKLNLSIDYIQADNQIDGAFPRVIIQKIRKPDDGDKLKPCLTVSILALPTGSDQSHLFRLFKVETASLSIHLDEGLILRCLLLGDKLTDKNHEKAENFTSDPQMAFLAEMRKNSQAVKERYYFEEISIVLDEIQASLYKQSELPTEIKQFKEKLPFPLIQFEDARIRIENYYSRYTFKELSSYRHDYKLFLMHCGKSQAYKLLGSFDFLGNPLGLAHDIKEGFNGVMKHGDFTSVIQGTTRGMANSASKFIGTVADVVSSFAADPTYEEDRRRRRTRENGEFGTVVDGLAYGIVGGVTSVVTQTYRGMKKDGPAGLITGLGRGMVGAVVKPMTGVLDFATGTASIIREKAEYRHKSKPDRPPRLVSGINGGLPIYDANEAHAQTILREIDTKSREPLFCVEKLKTELLLFITQKRVLLYGENFEEILNVCFKNMRQVVAYKNRLIMDLDTHRPAVECVDEMQALRLRGLVSSVRDLYRDEQHTLPSN